MPFLSLCNLPVTIPHHTEKKMYGIYEESMHLYSEGDE
jgi:hypothetical protein